MRTLSVVRTTSQIQRATIKIERVANGFRVRLRHPDDDGFLLLVEELKSAIDIDKREFDREHRCWNIDTDAGEALELFSRSQMQQGAKVSWSTGE